MFLKQIELKNLRSIQSMRISFAGSEPTQNRRWTILLGENGCGKSSALRAIGLVLSGSEALASIIGKPDNWIRNGAKQCTIAAQIETADGKSRDIALELARGDTMRDIYKRNDKSLDALDRALRHASRNYFIAGYGVARRPPSESEAFSKREPDFLPPRAQSIASLYSNDAPLMSLEQWIMQRDYTHGESALVALKEAVNQLLPGMTFSRIDKRQRQVFFKTVDGEVPLGQLSDGYQNMAAWCGDLLYRILQAHPDHNNPLNCRGVLLIDELDLHLHPVWRRRLVEFLDKTLPNFQIIATTHSALAAQQCGPDELYVIRREGRRNLPTLVPFVGEPRNMMLHQLLLSPMFGLSTLDSLAIQRKKDEARLLATRKGPLRASEKQRLAELRGELADTPQWNIAPKLLQKQLQVLESISAHLGTRASTIPIEKQKINLALKGLRLPSKVAKSKATARIAKRPSAKAKKLGAK
ncbi:MAG: AAA family ATPase [Burkholderiales bacterium]|nr:AAA family ATPase [Burkholderiales bacterium]